MIDGKITDYLGTDDECNRKFVLTLPPQTEYDGNPQVEKIKVAHDYVEFIGTTSIQQEQKDGKYPYQNGGAANYVSPVRVSIQIGIKEIVDFIMPLLANHEYCQAKHLEDRTHDKDDEYFAQYDLDKPRWKKGDKYPAYCYSGAVVEFYDRKEDLLKVAIRRSGNKHFDIISKELYNQIKSTLKVNYSKWEIEYEKPKNQTK